MLKLVRGVNSVQGVNLLQQQQRKLRRALRNADSSTREILVQKVLCEVGRVARAKSASHFLHSLHESTPPNVVAPDAMSWLPDAHCIILGLP